MQKIDYLNALGIDVWLPKNTQMVNQPSVEIAEQSPTPTDIDTRPFAKTAPAGNLFSGSEHRTGVYKHIHEDSSTEPENKLPAGVDFCKRSTWPELQCTISQCTACDLHKTRNQTVFGVGNENADIMIVGEAPGAHEDKQGEPFVGDSGQLLTEMIQTIGLKRNDVFISNILKCRPPENRDPLPGEIESCTPYLLQQIKHVQPRVILAVGHIAAQYLLATELSLGQLRNNTHHYGETKTPLLVTYHPAYLLRNPSAKVQAYEDLLRLQEIARPTESIQITN
jgi:uracil-DNA glycosylase